MARNFEGQERAIFVFVPSIIVWLECLPPKRWRFDYEFLPIAKYEGFIVARLLSYVKANQKIFKVFVLDYQFYIQS